MKTMQPTKIAVKTVFLEGNIDVIPAQIEETKTETEIQ